MINVEIGYMNDVNWETVDWEKFTAFWPLAIEKEKPKSIYSMNRGPVRISYEDAGQLVALGIPLEIKPLPGAMITKMQDRGEWDKHHQVTPAELKDAQAIQIAVPDQALMYIDEVTNLDDCCTDFLQDHLEKGWRILAVCPPNAARRPDYILGRRTKKDPFTQ